MNKPQNKSAQTITEQAPKLTPDFSHRLKRYELTSTVFINPMDSIDVLNDHAIGVLSVLSNYFLPKMMTPSDDAVFNSLEAVIVIIKDIKAIAHTCHDAIEGGMS